MMPSPDLVPSVSDVVPSSANPGFGVYIHWPFCQAKCPYCDFNSHVRHAAIDQPRYLEAFRRELRTTRERIGPRAVSSIFFGGGTPSLMTPATVSGILDEIAELWTVAANAEITLEANPSSVEAAKFTGFKTAGVNRVSLGVQSLVEADLKALGRIHSVAEAKTAIEIARRTFDRFTFDLIYARPGQTADAWTVELAEALKLASDHLSLYQLTIEPDTPFEALARAGKLHIPPPELADELWAVTQDMTAAAGLPAYEISNHARLGQESRHNVLYWRYGEYAGIGPGAHGRLLAGGQRFATATQRNPERWLALVEAGGHGLIDDQPLDRAEQADEALLMGLRLEEGLDLARLARLGAVRPSEAKIAQLMDLGMITRVGNHDRIRATSRGRFVLNRLVEELSASFVDAG
jgi:putative oxygen-independent coproporphyrinogen III oxidase